MSEASLKHAVLGARNSKGRWHFYTSQSLPFGSIASVYSFNKSARALQHLLWEDFSIVTTNYFDDFPTLEWASAADITTGVVSKFFQIIGWRHAVSGKKAKPFAPSFGALGVECTLGDLHKGRFTVGNKPERLERIGRMVNKIKENGAVSSTDSASIHGLLNFASGFTLGKSLQTSSHGFSKLASGHALSKQQLMDLCDHAAIILQSLAPREVEVANVPHPVVIYTDGAYDSNGSHMGGHSHRRCDSNETLLCGCGTRFSVGSLGTIGGRTTYLPDRDVRSPLHTMEDETSPSPTTTNPVHR